MYFAWPQTIFKYLESTFQNPATSWKVRISVLKNKIWKPWQHQGPHPVSPSLCLGELLSSTHLPCLVFVIVTLPVTEMWWDGVWKPLQSWRGPILDQLLDLPQSRKNLFWGLQLGHKERDVQICARLCRQTFTEDQQWPGSVCAEGCGAEWEFLCLRAVSAELGTRVPHMGALGPVLTSFPRVACPLGKVYPRLGLQHPPPRTKGLDRLLRWPPLCLSRSPGDKGCGRLCSASSHLERWAMKACCPGLRSHLQSAYCFVL